MSGQFLLLLATFFLSFAVALSAAVAVERVSGDGDDDGDETGGALRPSVRSFVSPSVRPPQDFAPPPSLLLLLPVPSLIQIPLGAFPPPPPPPPLPSEGRKHFHERPSFAAPIALGHLNRRNICSSGDYSSNTTATGASCCHCRWKDFFFKRAHKSGLLPILPLSPISPLRMSVASIAHGRVGRGPSIVCCWPVVAQAAFFCQDFFPLTPIVGPMKWDKKGRGGEGHANVTVVCAV